MILYLIRLFEVLKMNKLKGENYFEQIKKYVMYVTTKSTEKDPLKTLDDKF
jgi:hypothetical protein